MWSFNPYLKRKGPRGGKLSRMRRFMRETLVPKTRFDPRSFRTIAYPEKDSGARVVIGCPKGYWDPATERCKVGTMAHAVMRPLKSNPVTTLERIYFRGDGVYVHGTLGGRPVKFTIRGNQAAEFEVEVIDILRRKYRPNVPERDLETVDAVLFDIDRDELVAEVIGKGYEDLPVPPLSFRGIDAEALAHAVIGAVKEIKYREGVREQAYSRFFGEV